ncbi:hypothetical protein PoB_003161200 [Plakobranchus ocellatus]|uniref:Uncharacterized protein n=1 Tax=Plakobranchus ocellatus TaxID=259542 RepID=A0AAV4ACV7_9GAST|nr:hypothetical protein PoB_003161200 [Plakobranchus ocellatus]
MSVPDKVADDDEYENQGAPKIGQIKVFKSKRKRLLLKGWKSCTFILVFLGNQIDRLIIAPGLTACHGPAKREPLHGTLVCLGYTGASSKMHRTSTGNGLSSFQRKNDQQAFRPSSNWAVNSRLALKLMTEESRLISGPGGFLETEPSNTLCPCKAFDETQ